MEYILWVKVVDVVIVTLSKISHNDLKKNLDH